MMVRTTGEHAAREANVGGERCMVCGGDYPRWWGDTTLFLEVIGGHDGPSLLCPTCFDNRARAEGIELLWRPLRWDAESMAWMEADVVAAIADWRADRARAADPDLVAARRAETLNDQADRAHQHADTYGTQEGL